MKKSKKGFASRALIAVVSALALGFLVSQVYGYTVSKQVDNSGTQIRLLDSSGNLTIAGSLTSAGATSSSGLTVSGGAVNLGSFTETVADGAVITNEAKVAVLTGTTGGTTNTIANPSAAGEELILVNGSTFPIVFADSGNLSLSGAATLGQHDTLHLVSITATNWIEVAQADN